jgi:hypothetical protein
MKRKSDASEDGTTKRRNSRFAASLPAAAMQPAALAVPGLGVGFMQSDVMQRARKAIETQHTIQQQILTVSTIIANTKSSLVCPPPFQLPFLIACSQGIGKDTFKPAPLRLDNQGRAVDETGQVISQEIRPVASLQANIRGQEPGVNPYLAHKSVDTDDRSKTLDPRINTTTRNSRAAKSFEFVKQGTYIKQGEKARQIEERKIFSGLGSGRNSNSYSATGIAQMNELEEGASAGLGPGVGVGVGESGYELPSQPLEPVPGLEWWDEAYLPKEKRNERKTGVKNLEVRSSHVPIQMVGVQ